MAIIRPTSKVFAGAAGVTPAAAKAVSYAPIGGPYTDLKGIWRAPAGGPYVMKYSTPTAGAVGGGASAGSGASGSGTPTVNATAIPGGNHSGSLGYQWGGGSGLGYLNSNTATLTAYENFVGVANGSTQSAGPDTGVFCDVTDLVTGAVYRTNTIPMGPLSWTNTIPAESPISVVASDTGSSAQGFGSFTTSLTTSASVVPSGGSGVYPTYLHQYISGDVFSFNNVNLQNPTITSGSFFCPSLGTADRGGTYQVTVTDSEGHSTSDLYVVSFHLESVND